jgi:valyl-tRNA synthetase
METDVLDTWFSSGLWPLSTMGWPAETEDLKAFYPTSVLVTGYDILFFWVARMAMFGLKFRDRFLEEKLPVERRVPFHEVLLHGLLRDANGEKMSKTKGNGIDPLEMIGKYGADALRFTLAAGTTLGQDMVLAESTIEGYGNFINKIWNATKFHLIYVEKLGRPIALKDVTLGRFEKWILWALNELKLDLDYLLERRQFNEACLQLHKFTWHELCDWYLELSKSRLFGHEGPEAQTAAHATLGQVLNETLRLLHPFIPFVTEELWEALSGTNACIMIQAYPQYDEDSFEGSSPEIQQAELTMLTISALRTARTEHGVKPRDLVKLTIKSSAEFQKIFSNAEIQAAIKTVGGVGELVFDSNHVKTGGEIYAVWNQVELFILSEVADSGQERSRLTREISKLRPQVDKLHAKLANPGFVDKAPAAVVEKNRAELAGLQAQLDKLSQSLTQLGT